MTAILNHHFKSSLGDFYRIRTYKSRANRPIESLVSHLHRYTVVNRVGVRQRTDWFMPNSDLSPNDQLSIIVLK